MLVFICSSLSSMNSYAYYKAYSEHETKIRNQLKEGYYKQKVEKNSPEAREYKELLTHGDYYISAWWRR